MQGQRYVNINGNHNVTATLRYGLPLGIKGKGSNLKLDSKLLAGKDISLLNEERNMGSFFSVTKQVQASFSIREKLYADLAATIVIGSARYSLYSGSSNTFINKF